MRDSLSLSLYLSVYLCLSLLNPFSTPSTLSFLLLPSSPSAPLHARTYTSSLFLSLSLTLSLSLFAPYTTTATLYFMEEHRASRDFTYSHDRSWAVFCLVDGHCHVHFFFSPRAVFAFCVSRREINRPSLEQTAWSGVATLTNSRNFHDERMSKLHLI